AGRSQAGSVLETLTFGERRVAELVARGWTNKEVASALDLRAKTVEWTLTNIYRKLHLRSRTELALHVARSSKRLAEVCAATRRRARWLRWLTRAGARPSRGAARLPAQRARRPATSASRRGFAAGAASRRPTSLPSALRGHGVHAQASERRAPSRRQPPPLRR